MGNLLTYNASFYWAENDVDRNHQISNLNEAVISARNYGDKLYCHPNLFADGSVSQAFFILVWSNFENFRASFPWIKEPEYRLLSNVIEFFKQPPLQSLNLQELQQNTGINNNAWIGIECNCPEYLVHDNPSWHAFHRLFVSQFTLEQRRQNFEYFNKFFDGVLTRSINQIRQEIEQGRAHVSITRIDPPDFDHDKIHVHFVNNENCALNINGTWRHNDDGFRIPEGACIQLTEWGFKLPHEYYQI